MIKTDSASTKPNAAKRPRRMAREPQDGANQAEPKSEGSKLDECAAVKPKRETKADLVLDLLRREGGATIDQLVAATGWLPHTTRAALTGLKKKGHAVTSAKPDGADRTYRVVAPAEVTQ